MRLITRFVVGAVALLLGVSCTSKVQELKVMQLNLWMACSEVPGAFQGLVDEVVALEPDLIALCESTRDDVWISVELVDTLSSLGLKYYTSVTSGASYLSRYPIIETYSDTLGVPSSFWRMLVDIGGRKVALYSGHLDYRNYACYDARGYDGWTWQKSEVAPSVDFIMEKNNRSFRDEQIKELIEYSKADVERGYAVIVAGDFNEPSHLDWTEDTKNMYDHNGFVVPWTCSTLLYEAGFLDSYRVKYPDPITHPGFTYPSDNALIEPSKLTWAPEVDERDRIDYIYYYPREWFAVKDISVLGPNSTIVRCERQVETSQDNFITPVGTWPTDHKGMFSVFEIKEK